MSTPQFDVQNVLKQADTLDIATQFQPYSGVEIVVDDNTTYTSGDASGRVLTIENPWGTQAMADNILASIRGFQYQPYEAQGAMVDPAAELGDGVSVNDVYSGIYKIDRNYSSLMDADISAPQSEEIDHEYPYESSQSRTISRKFSAIESEFAIQSNLISAKVSQTGGGSSFSWELQNDHFTIYSSGNPVFYVNSGGASIAGTVYASSGVIGGFSITGDAITYNGIDMNTTNKAGVYLGPAGIRINGSGGSYFRASSWGNVEANNLVLTGTLYIGGQAITADVLRSGAQTAYNRANTWNGTTTTVSNNSGTWSTGAGYGYNYNSAITANNETGGLRCNYLRVNTSARFQGLVIAQNGIGVGSGGTATWQTKTISGVTINYLGKA